MTETIDAADRGNELAFRAAAALCRKRLRAGAYLTSALLPRPKRQAVWAASALCYLIQDAIGAAGQSADSYIEMLHARLADIYEGRLHLRPPAEREEADHVLHAASLIVGRYQISRQYFLDLAEGWRHDRVVHRYPTWESLLRHCQSTGGTVALILSCIIGLTHSDASRHAVALGSAIRFSEILRNIARDSDAGKIYLPIADMARFKYSERDLRAKTVNDNFRELIRFQIDRARNLYREAADGFCWLGGDGSRLAVSAIAIQHAAALKSIEQQDCNAFARAGGTSVRQRLVSLPQVWRLARRESGEPLPKVF